MFFAGREKRAAGSGRSRVVNPDLCASRRYIKSWFFLDVLSSLPVAIIALVADIQELDGYFMPLKLVRIRRLDGRYPNASPFPALGRIRRSARCFW